MFSLASKSSGAPEFWGTHRYWHQTGGGPTEASSPRICAHLESSPQNKRPPRTKVQPNSSFISDAGFLHTVQCARKYSLGSAWRQGRHGSTYTGVTEIELWCVGFQESTG